jgi:hypothetical protein
MLTIGRLVERAVDMVPGIIDVRPSVAWSRDDRRAEPVILDSLFPIGPR